jgi:hypothetical protein
LSISATKESSYGDKEVHTLREEAQGRDVPPRQDDEGRAVVVVQDVHP